uniref:Type I restriction enzyme R protein N-terminal domain-containing protein n=1 Tax=Cyanothece sp. (strain PCC 7425 / ATCC 29141) TaxID=395961 RepID=B8HKN8_CYAP4
MPYSQFTTIRKVKEAFNLTTVEGDRFIPAVAPISPSDLLAGTLKETLPIVATSGSEKARSEGIIYPVLLEVRRMLDRTISLFSGEDFTIEEAVGLNGTCDFLLTRSTEVLEIEAPTVVIVEAKKTDLKTGLGQCIAEMVAAQRFNEEKGNMIPTIYGSVSNGIQWQFLKLEQQVVTIDLTIYPLPPVDQILSFFVWMVKEG